MDLSYPLRRGLLASALLAALATPAYAQTADQRMSALEAKIKQLEDAQAQTTQALQDARVIRVEYGGVRVLDLEALRRYTPTPAAALVSPIVQAGRARSDGVMG